MELICKRTWLVKVNWIRRQCMMSVSDELSMKNQAYVSFIRMMNNPAGLPGKMNPQGFFQETADASHLQISWKWRRMRHKRNVWSEFFLLSESRPELSFLLIFPLYWCKFPPLSVRKWWYQRRTWFYFHTWIRTIIVVLWLGSLAPLYYNSEFFIIIVFYFLFHNSWPLKSFFITDWFN